MPELPEVETVKESLKDLIINEKIESVDVYYSKIIKNVDVEEFKESFRNETFKKIERRGKYLVFFLDDLILVSHLRMEGKYFIRGNEEVTKHEHIVFNLTDGKTFRYNDTRKFGVMYLFKTTDFNEVLSKEPLCKLAKDANDETLTIDYLKNRFLRINKPIKSTLLDQTIISGLGNIYVDEVCFMSKLNPNKKTSSLTDEEIESIINNSRIVLSKAIKLGGTTIKSFVSSHEISGLFQNELLVHTKEICPICNSKIEKIRVGGRGTYFCPNCQKL